MNMENEGKCVGMLCSLGLVQEERSSYQLLLRNRALKLPLFFCDLVKALRYVITQALITQRGLRGCQANAWSPCPQPLAAQPQQGKPAANARSEGSRAAPLTGAARSRPAPQPPFPPSTSVCVCVVRAEGGGRREPLRPAPPPPQAGHGGVRLHQSEAAVRVSRGAAAAQ